MPPSSCNFLFFGGGGVSPLDFLSLSHISSLPFPFFLSVFAPPLHCRLWYFVPVTLSSIISLVEASVIQLTPALLLLLDRLKLSSIFLLQFILLFLKLRNLSQYLCYPLVVSFTIGT